jgi:hypothetical protein
MGKRYNAIGIKQAIRFEWMQKAANLLLAGLDDKTIRQELHEILADKKGDGSEGEKSDLTRTFAVNNLMNIWVSPDPELIPLRDASLGLLQVNPAMSVALHWGMISSAYPFWFNVARQTGRLLALQNQVTQAQIINRLKEQYGDRQTVSRYARFVIRSFVSWGILHDADTHGCYEKTNLIQIHDAEASALLIESALLATPEGQIDLNTVLNHPALFPFSIQHFSGDSICQKNKRLDLVRYGLDSELLKLRF